MTAATSAFTALRVHAPEKNRTEARFETLAVDALTDGEVVIRVAWSGINYKDALAVTGKGRILKKFPLVPGIDLAGHVESSTDPRYQPGDAVLDDVSVGQAPPDAVHERPVAEPVRSQRTLDRARRRPGRPRLPAAHRRRRAGRSAAVRRAPFTMPSPTHAP